MDLLGAEPVETGSDMGHVAVEGAASRGVARHGSPIFLSHSAPETEAQVRFVDDLRAYLQLSCLSPRTLGVTDYNFASPLAGVYEVMAHCNGVLVVAFKKTKITSGVVRRRRGSRRANDERLENVWLASPWTHIESGIAFALGLPVLVLREEGVYDDGVLEDSVTGFRSHEFDPDSHCVRVLDSPEVKDLLVTWQHAVQTVVATKGRPPRLY